MDSKNKIDWENAILKVLQLNNNKANLQTLYDQVPKLVLNSTSEDIPHTIRAYLRRLKQKKVIEQTGESSYILIQSSSKHKNYEILNLIGYGLAKFDDDFIRELGFKKKTDFYNHIVDLKIAETVGTVKNRQDLFDPFFDNGRKGWWQKGDAYIHRKIFIDSLFGSLDASAYANIVKLYLQDKFAVLDKAIKEISPVIKSKFKQIQVTGQEAELFFMSNYKKVDSFENGIMEDARMFGDGYDFQIEVQKHFFLAEIKGLRTNYGSIRMTQNEFIKAKEYNNDYALVVVSNLNDIPKMSVIFDPIENISFTEKTINTKQVNYHTSPLKWQ